MSRFRDAEIGSPCDSAELEGEEDGSCDVKIPGEQVEDDAAGGRDGHFACRKVETSCAPPHIPSIQ